ncbi:Glycosyltransferase family 92 protein [Trichostrongylus colubriformis]|uniref:Glycosyltransferase family 92 protein n=1 Tax=Trichostrongylus colubriformis TaxID=6319 RepID=A0AAN8FPN7_TRICO
MHDCMLRARSHVKFIANFDLDDFPVATNGSLPDVLNQINDENVNIAEIIIDWKLTKQKIQWNSLQTPSDIRFMLSASKLIGDKSVRYDYRVSRKMFTRPERVAVFDMHSVYRNELIPGERKQYGHVIHSSHRLFILHMRRFQRNLIHNVIHYNTTINTRFLVGLNRKMMVNFRKRIKSDKFAAHQMAPWATEASEILRNLEQCRKEAFGVALTDDNRICQQSSGGCEPMLMTKSNFIRAPMSWIDLAHKAAFNSYTR